MYQYFVGSNSFHLQFSTPNMDTVYSTEILVKFYPTASRHARSSDIAHIRTAVKASDFPYVTARVF
jgi:hypothetical protein